MTAIVEAVEKTAHHPLDVALHELVKACVAAHAIDQFCIKS